MKTNLYVLSILALFFFSVGANAQCTITSGPTVTPNGLMISVTGTGTGATFPGYGYDWGDQTAPGTSQTSTHTYASAGTYTLCMYYLDLTAATTCIDSSCMQITVAVTGINDPTAAVMNVQTAPNPFNTDMNINVTLTQTENVEMVVYDLTGKQVVVLKNGLMPAGTNVVNWKPAGVAEGIYYLQVKAGNTIVTKKVVYTSGN
jgi:hypothetical protein